VIVLALRVAHDFGGFGCIVAGRLKKSVNARETNFVGHSGIKTEPRRFVCLVKNTGAYFSHRSFAQRKMADCIRAVPTIDLPDDELAAVTAAIRGVIEIDRYPHAPRLDSLRAALGKFEAALAPELPKAPARGRRPGGSPPE
jgi:hypothetical protein